MAKSVKTETEQSEKKTPVKLRPILREHAGKITEPWRIMESLVAECDCFAHLRSANIRMFWRKDWPIDADGIATGAQCAKASELDRILAESSGESFDLSIKLPEEAWPTLDDVEKEHRIFHEMCHFKATKDSNGQQRRDSKDRLLWRIGRHPIAAFPEEIEQYGIERVLGHNAKIVESIGDAERPMEKVWRETENNEEDGGNGKDGVAPAWRPLGIQRLGLPPRAEKALREAGVTKLGKLSDLMAEHESWWYKEVPGVGEKMAEIIADLFTAFWQSNPEYCRQ